MYDSKLLTDILLIDSMGNCGNCTHSFISSIIYDNNIHMIILTE